MIITPFSAKSDTLVSHDVVMFAYGLSYTLQVTRPVATPLSDYLARPSKAPPNESRMKWITMGLVSHLSMLRYMRRLHIQDINSNLHCL